MTIDVTFYYKNTKPSAVHELIITSLAHVLHTIIELPPTLEVCLYELPDNVYGGIDRYVANRFGINYNLPLESIPEIVVHELIHISQRYLNVLQIKNNGHYYWHGIPYSNILPEDMTYDEYKSCPWEIDVDNRLAKLLSRTLDVVKKQQLPKD